MKRRLPATALIVLAAVATPAHSVNAKNAPLRTRSAAPAGRPCGTRHTPPATYRHVVWIVMENKAYSKIIGSANAPYLNRLARACGSATKFSNEFHPSLPNYIAMTSGSTQGISDDDDPSAHRLRVASIFSQLGKHWRALAESMPSSCDHSDAGLYAVRHNPAVYFTNVAKQCRRQDVRLTPQPDLSARFTFITPNRCHDMHSCPSTGDDEGAQTRAGDAWLSKFMPKILGSREYKAGSTAIFVTWDEDDNRHIPTIVLSPYTHPGTRSASKFNHYSLLRTTEELLGIQRHIGNAVSAASMRRAFHL